MNLLIVCQTNNKYYLMTAGDNAIQAYHSKEEVMKAFSGFTNKWKDSYTWQMSACIGMMQMNPIAIQALFDIKKLTSFILNPQIVQISGGAIGKGYCGVEVHPSILELKIFDIWHESMIEGEMYPKRGQTLILE